MDAEKLAKGCEERAIIFDGADAMFLAQHERDCAKVIKNLLERAESAEARAEKAEKIVEEYAEAARAIALWLSAFCDKSMFYPQMIRNAARKISVAYEVMEKRAEKAEKERDAAVDDLKRFGQCGACKNYYREDGCGAGPYSYCDGGFEWRGEKT